MDRQKIIKFSVSRSFVSVVISTLVQAPSNCLVMFTPQLCANCKHRRRTAAQCEGFSPVFSHSDQYHSFYPTHSQGSSLKASRCATFMSGVSGARNASVVPSARKSLPTDSRSETMRELTRGRNRMIASIAAGCLHKSTR